jgi:hypothetical protein
VTEPILALSAKDAIVPTAGGSASFTVKARDTGWIMTGQPLWVHPSLSSGPKGLSQVKLTVDPLAGATSRYSTITFTSDTTTVTYTLDQTNASALSVSLDRLMRNLTSLLNAIATMLSGLTLNLFSLPT